jgi:hypothetical protein
MEYDGNREILKAAGRSAAGRCREFHGVVTAPGSGGERHRPTRRRRGGAGKMISVIKPKLNGSHRTRCRVRNPESRGTRARHVELCRRSSRQRHAKAATGGVG